MSAQEEALCFAVIGTPIKHSLSAVLHTAVFEKLGLLWQTALVDPGDSEGFAHLIEDIRTGAASYRGANITIPYKETVIPFCAELSAAAARCGAVNTLWRDGAGKLIGNNSDVGGFLEALKLELGLEAAKVQNAVICGAGGVARAIASALASAGVGELTILSRSEGRAEDFIKSLCCKDEKTIWRGASYADISRTINSDERFDLCVNATPLGMLNDATQEMPQELLELIRRQARRLFDVVYRRDEPTALVRWARKQGIPATDGLAMLIEQAIISLRLWGVPAEPEPLRVIMREALADEGITR